MADKFERKVARKVLVSELLNGEYKRSDDGDYVEIRGMDVSRANVIATLVEAGASNEDGYVSASVDDGTGLIKLRAWGEAAGFLEGINVGDIVIVVGRVREFGGTKYLTPEVIKKLNSKWLIFRRKELGSGNAIVQEKKVEASAVVEDFVSGGKVDMPMEVVEDMVEDVVEGEKTTSSSGRGGVVELIEKLDSGDGADIVKIISESGMAESEVKILVDELVKEGEIFEVRPGFLRSLI